MGKKRSNLGWVELSIKKLIKANWNYKKEDPEKTNKLKENIKRNGQVENLLVRELDTGYYEIVNGNHRLDVLKDLNFKKVFCYNFGIITEQSAIRIAIETNETKFGSDELKLAERINELITEFGQEDLVATMPYSETELNNFKELLNFDWEQYNNETSLDDPDYKETYVKITVDISEHTYKLWKEINDKMEKILGYKNEGKVFEFMCAEMNNVPLESIK